MALGWYDYSFGGTIVHYCSERRSLAPFSRASILGIKPRKAGFTDVLLYINQKKKASVLSL